MKILLFGIGYWGKNHLRELSNNDKVTSLIVVDPFFESYTDLMNKYSDVKFYHSFSDALAENKNIDGAVIATPPSTHFEIAKKCLENGIHVLVEKPMVESLDELKQLNGDYLGKRVDNINMTNPRIKVVEHDVFDFWLKSKNKLGGQHKVPRLSEERSFIEEILDLSVSLRRNSYI